METIRFEQSTKTNENKDNADNIIKQITIKDQENFPSKPSVEISEQGASELALFEQKIVEQNEMEKEKPILVAVVRCWGKSKEDIQKFIQRINKFKNSIPELSGVFVSINQEGEIKNPKQTEKNLQDIIKESPADIPIIPLEISEYSWTSGLNAPIAVTNQLCAKNKIKPNKVKIMNVSFGVDLEQDELEKIKDNIEKNDFAFTARKTSEGQNPFFNNDNGDEIWDKFVKILKFPNESDLSEIAYTMRNTLNIIRLDHIISLGGFNPLCNGESRTYEPTQPSPFYRFTRQSQEPKVIIRGMEDSEFFMRLILNALQTGKISVLKKLREAMTHPIFYTDADWNKMHELKKIQKIGNEMTALSLIISGIATKESVKTGKPGVKKTIGLVNGFRVPTALQDFKIN